MASRLASGTMVKKFEHKDKKALLDLCQQVLKVAGNGKNSDPIRAKIKKLIFQLCWQTTFGKMQMETAITILSEVAPSRIFMNIIIDALAGLDCVCQTYDNTTARERYLSLLRMCCGKIIPEASLKERLDFETLGESSIIRFLKNSQTKFIKMKTRLFYKQQKFNLFREESEGYAKLVVELNAGLNTDMHAKYALEATKSLIGCFNLDPNRVLDIILESFEHRPEMYNFFVFLLRSFCCTSSTLSQVVGFKFGFYQVGSDKTPKSLYTLTALLLKEELLNLNNIYGLLMPDDSKISEKQKDEITSAQLYVRQLNSTAIAIDKANPTKPATEEVPLELEDDDDNQKLGLCAALLDVGDWKHAEQLMRLFPEFYAVSHDFIAKKLCTLAHVLTEKMYMQNSYSIFITKGGRWQLESNITIQEVASFPELFGRVFPMIIALGPYLHIDPILMAKVIRLSRQWMLQKNRLTTDSNMDAIIDVVDRALLPSLSLMECNCCVAEELWNLLKLFPYQTRYCFYGQWKTSTSTSLPLLIKKKADSLKRLKYIMKRLSKENVKPSGRQIGKLSHTSPGDLFDYILSQIQTWDNLIVPVVDSLKYLTSLSYDVLAYCIMEALANPEKDRMKHDGTSISVWLQSLASFGGAVFKKYPIDIAGLLQYVGNQLKKEKSLDLLILKEVVQKMAGIEASEEMTPEQVEAMTGGELLRTEGGYFNQLRNVKKSSQRLKEALLDQGLAIPLCLLMSQQRQGILFGEQEQSHIKLIGKLYDQCQDTLVQFGSFLASNLSMDDYMNRVPSIAALFSQYNIDADIAFFLVRPTFSYAINAKFDELKKQDKANKNSSNTEKYLEAIRITMEPTVESIWAETPSQNWDDLSPQIYVTFWSLSVYDLSVPTESYEREISKLKVLAQSEENKDVNKKKKEKERCDALIAKLTEEEKMQHDHVALVTARLKHEKNTWFNNVAPKTETITQFLQQCLFPRCIFTPVDATYCAKFLHLIHYLKTPNFSTLLCYDRIFCDITTTVAFCTENQANRYGLFLCTMLETIMRWHNDRAIFDQECAFFPGFMTKFKGAATQGEYDSSDHVDYENYRHVCHKWHFKITRALLNCLDSADFIQIRNALLVLIKLSPHFPVVTNLGSAIENRIQKIKTDEKDKRPDLFTLATGYAGILKSKKSTFIPEGEFHLKEVRTFAKSELQVKSDNAKSTRLETSRTSAGSKSMSDKQNSINTSSSAQSSKSKSKEVDHNGLTDGVRISKTSSSSRLKEDKNDTSGSPMRREDRIVINKNDGKEEKSSRDRRSAEDHEKSSSTRSTAEKESNESSGRESHSHRRSNNELGESEREHKRRRTENMSSKSPRDSEREVRNVEKSSKDDDKSSSNTREKSSEKLIKSHKESSETNSEKVKLKDKKLARKRDYNDDSVQEQPRRRRAKTDEDADKRLSDARREEKSPLVYITTNSQESSRRTDREEKKHRRSSSVTVSKKRS